jgi:hypothetical protein
VVFVYWSRVRTNRGEDENPIRMPDHILMP